MEFLYNHWATHGVGSSVTFQDEMGSRVIATLDVREAETVVLHILYRMPEHFASTPGEMRFEEILRSKASEPRPTSLVLQGRAPKPPASKSGRSTAVVPSGPPIREGDEVIEIAGEEWLTHWAETPATHSGMNVLVKTWISEKIPGGLVRWEMRTGPEDSAPQRWFVTEFERK
jgi:hypothetical protein